MKEMWLQVLEDAHAGAGDVEKQPPRETHLGKKLHDIMIKYT